MGIKVLIDRMRDYTKQMEYMVRSPPIEYMRPYVEDAAKMGVGALRRYAPIGDTEIPGKSADEPDHVPLREGINYDIRVEQNQHILTFYGPPHALFVIGGTEPHGIPYEELPSKVLYFYFAALDEYVFFKRVNHPGTRPNLFHIRALESIRRDFYGRLRLGAIYANRQAIEDFFTFGIVSVMEKR